eukprot:COSAG02_NODE_3776_length_6248_cov_9.635876_2_plen_87_part_00
MGRLLLALWAAAGLSTHAALPATRSTSTSTSTHASRHQQQGEGEGLPGVPRSRRAQGCADPCDAVDCGAHGSCWEGQCYCNGGYSK